MVLAILWITAMFYNMPFLFVFTNVNNIHGFTSINLADTFIQHVLQIIKNVIFDDKRYAFRRTNNITSYRLKEKYIKKVALYIYIIGNLLTNT